MASLTRSRASLLSVPPLLTLSLLLVIAVVVLSSLNGGPNTGGLSLTVIYLVVLISAVYTVRRAVSNPGRWLARRAIRRAIVGLSALTCAVLLAFAPWLGGTVALLLLLLGLCQLLLSRATQQIASSLPRPLDERQSHLRDRGFRVAYWLLAPIVVAFVVVGYLGSASSRGWLASSTDIAPLGVLIALLIVLPGMVIAWLEPDQANGSPRLTTAQRRTSLLAMALVVVTLGAPVAAAASVLSLPLRETQLIRHGSNAGAGGCAYFQRNSSVGVWFTATLPLSTEVCWNGRLAHYRWGMNRSDCRASYGVLTSLSPDSCRRHTEPDGTLTFRYSAWVHPFVLSFLTRRVEVSVAIDRDGRSVRG